MKKFIHNTGVILNIIAAVPLLLAIVSVYFNPSKFWLPAFFGLGFPYLLLINLLFVVYWIIRMKWAVLISAITILCGINHITNFIQLHCSDKMANMKQPGFKLLSYNVRLFDFYNWKKTKAIPQHIINYVKIENPDILCFQEFVSATDKYCQTLDSVPSLRRLRYQHFIVTRHEARNYYYGVVTFSAWPIIDEGCIRFENSVNVAIYTDLKINNDTIRVYNIHLQSIHFEAKNYQFLDSMSFRYDEFNKKGISDIFSKLRNAYIIRSRQAGLVTRHIASSPYPVIVCGDFNDTPISYVYHTIRDHLKDAFVESGCGIEYTYSGKFPSFRIDYILHSDKLKSFEYKTPRIEYSDHYPVQCCFSGIH
ncbi:MAG: endonuclease/exonuclease/phosphatase family protein [Bacteroidia bacterium]|nr:endonuclease/exonuclease/phosphatase family protein [Bacteroidia bacterium]